MDSEQRAVITEAPLGVADRPTADCKTMTTLRADEKRVSKPLDDVPGSKVSYALFFASFFS